MLNSDIHDFYIIFQASLMDAMINRFLQEVKGREDTAQLSMRYNFM